MKIKIVMFVLLTTVLAFSGCENVSGTNNGGTDPNGSDPNGTEDLNIAFEVVGTTQYSPDGGISTQEASFKFGVPVMEARAAETGSIVPVEGLLRADDFLIEISGTYNYETGEFCISASGTVITTEIDLTINGVYEESENPTVDPVITDATTTVVITDTATGDSVVFTSTVVNTGDSTTNPIEAVEENPGDLTVAEEVSEVEKKFWEGTWAASQRMYFTPILNDAGETLYFDQTQNVTDYWMDAITTMVVTERQYNCSFSFAYSDAYSQANGLYSMDDSEMYLVMVLHEILEEEANSMTGIFMNTIEDTVYGTSETSYTKTTIYLPEPGYLWGYSYHNGEILATNDNGTPDDTSDDENYYNTSGSSAEEVKLFTQYETGNAQEMIGMPGYARVE